MAYVLLYLWLVTLGVMFALLGGAYAMIGCACFLIALGVALQYAKC